MDLPVVVNMDDQKQKQKQKRWMSYDTQRGVISLFLEGYDRYCDAVPAAAETASTCTITTRVSLPGVTYKLTALRSNLRLANVTN
tara:strand:- start:406 stop:660 length:255 start_codon:yes stop_codon:yes gene_type:complete